MTIATFLGRLRRRKVGRLLALDFDGRQLRLVRADVSGGRTRIERFLTVTLPEALDAADAQAVGEFLGRTLADEHLAGLPLVMTVPRGKAVFKALVLPPVDDEADLAGMVRFQAQKELTFRPEEAVIDFALEAHYGVEPPPADEVEGRHVLAAAVQKDVVRYYEQVAEAAGVPLLRLGLRPYANMLCAQAYAAGDVARFAIIHLMAGEAEIDIVEEGGLTFSRSADITLPATGDTVPAREAALAGVVQEIARSVQSYLAVERDRTVDRVLLAGGTGVEVAVAEALAPRLRAPCEVFDPSPHLRTPDVPADVSAFVSVLGLAQGHGDAAPPFDFLHPKQPPVRRDPTRTVVLATASAVILVIVSAFAGAAIHLYNANAELADRQKELEEIKEASKSTLVLAKRVRAMEEWLGNGRDWLQQWAYLSGAVPPCQEVYVTSLKTGEDGTVNLNVKARSSQAVDAIGQRLANAGYGFKPGQVTTTKDRFGYNYVTSTKAIVEADMKVDLGNIELAARPRDDASATRFQPEEPSQTAEARPQPEIRRQDDRSRQDDRGRQDDRSRQDDRGRQDDGKRQHANQPKSPEDKYQAWQRQVQEMMKRRPDRDASRKQQEAWRDRMKNLYKQRPSKPKQGSDTRHPDARY